MITLNLILAFAQYTIYRVNMLCRFRAKQFSFFSLISELEKELLMNLKFLEKKIFIKLTEKHISNMQTL